MECAYFHPWPHGQPGQQHLPEGRKWVRAASCGALIPCTKRLPASRGFAQFWGGAVSDGSMQFVSSP